MSDIFPEDRALTIATWPSYISDGEVTHLRAVVPLRSFKGLSRCYSYWLTEKDWLDFKTVNESVIYLIENSASHGDTILGAFMYFSPNSPSCQIISNWRGRVHHMPVAHQVSFWISVLGQSFEIDPETGSTQSSYFPDLKDLSAEEQRKLLPLDPALVYDMSIFELLGLPLPWFQDYDTFMGWVKGLDR